MANMDFFSVPSLTMDEAALYYGERPSYRHVYNKKQTTRVREGSFSGSSNITNKKIIEVEFNVFSIAYNKTEFVKTFYLETYTEVYSLFKKYEACDARYLASYQAFTDRFRFKDNEDNYLKIEIKLPMHLYKKHTIMDLNNETSDFEILPKGLK